MIVLGYTQILLTKNKNYYFLNEKVRYCNYRFCPTGGTLANLLALHGFSILIVEKEKSFYPLPRAVHFDDEIMRVFQTIGITDKFLKTHNN